jgi:hypothetical protein
VVPGAAEHMECLSTMGSLYHPIGFGDTEGQLSSSPTWCLVYGALPYFLLYYVSFSLP